MLASARRRTWRMADSYLSSPARGGFVGRAFSPAAWGLPPPQGSGMMPASSPTKHRAMSCRILQDISAASRQCTPPSAPYGASTSPYRGGFANGFRPKGSPVRGAVGVRRLRGAAPDLANILPSCLNPPRPCGAALTQNHSAPFATLPGGRSRPPYNITYTCNGAGSGSLPLRKGRCSHRPADGPGKKLPLSYHLPFPAAM